MPHADETNRIPAELARRARDAAYVAVGLGVLGLQRVQVVRNELMHEDRVDEGVARLRSGVATGGRQITGWLDHALSFVSSQLSPLGAQLPEPARDLAEKARIGFEAISAQLRHLATPDA
jgi:hypothetical protein